MQASQPTLLDYTLWLVLLATLTWALVTGPPTQQASPQATCGGEIGKHCGCTATGCAEPCSSCCTRMPCPVEGASPAAEGATCR